MARLLLALFLVLPLAGSEDLEADIKRFLDVLLTVSAEAADPVDFDQVFYQGAIPGMLRRLDPHSVFFDPEQLQQLKRLQTSTEKGFGTVVSVLPGRVIILQTFPGTPSATAGIQAGDEIIAINGIQLSQLDTEQLIQVLGMARQQTARLAVRRTGQPSLMSFMLDPQEIDSPSVDRAFPLRGGVGYVRIKSFDRGTGRLLKETIEQLGGRGLAGLVLDLRNNPGGVLVSAFDVCSLFLKPGAKLVSTRGRAVEESDEVVPKTAEPYEFPLAVLVDGRSASAAEVVAGALQDHDRAEILGEPTFGKGLVERVYQLSHDTGLALTTAFYYTPSGRSIQKPLRDVALNPGSASAAGGGEFLTGAGRKMQGGGGIHPDRVVLPEPLTRLRAFLDGTAAFTAFASEFLKTSPEITEEFTVSRELLDQFEKFLHAHDVKPGLPEWYRDRDWIVNRLHTEIFNLKFGVAKGEEIEARRDPPIQAAIDSILKTSAAR